MATDSPFIYDPRYMEFQEWAALLCEQYAAQQLAIPNDSTKWQDWGAGLLAIDVFTNNAIPSPYGFDDWKDWAAALLGAISPEPN